MARRVVDLRSGGRPLLDIASYGRTRGRPLTPTQRQQIILTIGRAPEVMVKVTGGARSLKGVEAHLAYIGRDGELGVETDYGFRLVGKNFEKQIVPDWDLDLAAHRRQDARSIRGNRPPAKLVHNITFSMPPGTPAAKVLKAVRMLAANEFALRHRYVMVLHTDASHPHVHVVVKAVSEQGERLNIRKATLRHWREQFAAHLRVEGIAANATERAVRGQSRARKKDAIYRAMKRRESTHEGKELASLASKAAQAVKRHRCGKERLEQTRGEVVTGWMSIGGRFLKDGDYRLADRVRRFVDRMAVPVTDQELLVRQLFSQGKVREVHPLERNR